MATWTWTFEDAEGRPVAAAVPQPAEGFPTQADAETWVGEGWRALLAGGAEGARLLRDGQQVGGLLGLRPGE